VIDWRDISYPKTLKDIKAYDKKEGLEFGGESEPLVTKICDILTLVQVELIEKKRC
jgi:hypothetical protein